MADYTPTTDEVLEAYASDSADRDITRTYEEHLADARRWLAQHDAEVAANTVLGVMHRLDCDDPRVGEQLTQMHDEWLREARS